jgi:hypothetical protein
MRVGRKFNYCGLNLYILYINYMRHTSYSDEVTLHISEHFWHLMKFKKGKTESESGMEVNLTEIVFRWRNQIENSLGEGPVYGNNIRIHCRTLDPCF